MCAGHSQNSEDDAGYLALLLSNLIYPLEIIYFDPEARLLASGPQQASCLLVLTAQHRHICGQATLFMQVLGFELRSS